ncbi:uncharacterized protein LOC133888720 isoform X2 [Phragmites australis]|uniref:uncharacterized protein LOC133888720 isoform X2 n=1 Tax=Phragmites australis TaxID=29695 RepID=UPI002D798A6E|nr:uncharacterized protein LOC133888720 isoform X2 [Phragmites australis]
MSWVAHSPIVVFFQITQYKAFAHVHELLTCNTQFLLASYIRKCTMMYHYNSHRSSVLSHYGLIISQVVSVVLENYESPYANSDNNDATVKDRRIRWVSEVLNAEGHEPPAITILTRVPSWKDIRAAHEKNQKVQIFGQEFVCTTLLEYPGKQQQSDEFWKLYSIILIITISGHLPKDLHCVSFWIYANCDGEICMDRTHIYCCLC